MKVVYEWLKDLTGITESAEEVANTIMFTGLEIEKLIPTGIGKVNIVCAEILTVEKHPNADKLFVTTMDCGSFGKKQIITNIKGLSQNTKLLVALEGVTLANGLTIKNTKLKGTESEGMIVGWEELGFNFKSEEPIFLEENIKNGTLYYEILPIIDTVIDIELTANRGDCLGMVGISREIFSLFDTNLKELKSDYKTLDEKASDFIQVEINTKNCYRYCGGVIRDVKIAPSPLWMQLRLIKAGIRPINNVVDITNYILLEQNQPLHAFDMDKIVDNKIIVRDAKENEKLITLDDIERELVRDDIVIADREKGHCLGGVMGGQISEVTESTKNIFLEAAFFRPQNIRKTSKRLGLRSESSYRFEREIDRDGVDKALRRALYLFDTLGVGKVANGIIDEYPNKLQQRILSVNPSWINEKLGSNISEEEIKNILSNLGFRVKKEGKELIIVVPSWRNDVSIKEDIAEEVGRIFGYNNIAPTFYPSREAAMRTPFQQKEKKLRELFYMCGLDETMNSSFVGYPLLNKFNFPDEHPMNKFLGIISPATDELAGIRSALLPGMIRTASFNANRQNKELAFFEIGNVCHIPNVENPQEEKRACILLMGLKEEKSYLSPEIKYDYFDLKGIIDIVGEIFRVNFQYTPLQENFFHPYQQAQINLDGKSIGIMGKLHPTIADTFDIDNDVFIAEFSLNDLFNIEDKTIVYDEIPKYPSSKRDLAIIVDRDITSQKIIDTVFSNKIEYLKSATLFDIYKGKELGENKYSAAISMVFNKKSSTLTDEEVDNAIKQILTSLEKECGAKIR